MAAKPHFRIRSSALALIATAIGFLSFASASHADTGTVYFDANANVGAGKPGFLLNGTLTGFRNVGIGQTVMVNLTTGFANVGLGGDALADNTTGNSNTATGDQALISNTTGGGNVGVGPNALLMNTTGNSNIAMGTNSLLNTTGSNNVAIGTEAGQNLTTGSGNIYLGNQGQNAAESKVIRIGTKGDQSRAFIAGISGKTVSGTGTPVVVNSQGQLGTASAVAAKSGAAKPLSASTGRRLLATVKRQQRQIERQGKEIRALRAETG